jgi:hemerythrin superfamily protein
VATSSTTTTRPRTKRPAVSSSAPSAVALLTQDHRDVEALFKKFEGLGKRAHKSREATVGKIIEALSKHAVIEEQVFYPQVRARMTETNDDVLEALEEHHVVKWTLSELEKMSSEDERYEAKVTVLMESVRHHVKEEEKGLFPRVRKAMSRTDLEEMGEQLLAAKKAAPTRPHPRSPDTPPANIVATALTAPIDAAASVMSSAVDKIRDATR